MKKTYADITKEDIEAVVGEIYKNRVSDPNHIEVTSINETQYRIRGKGFLIHIEKELWHTALKENIEKGEG